jgi:hypothetical protein
MRVHAAFRSGQLLGRLQEKVPGKGDLGAPIMRHIHLDDGLRLRFPGRSEDFDQGVEIGMIAVLMDQGFPEFSRWIARATLSQVQAIAKQMGYRIEQDGGDEEWVEVTFLHGTTKAKPKLRLVHSAG